MAKIRVILPVTAEKLYDTVLADAKSWADDNHEIDVVQIAHGPESIENDYDETLAGTEILRLAAEAQQEGVAGIFISCFAEPSVHAAREIFDGPVYGGFQPSVHAALGLADRIGILSILPDVVSHLYRKIGSYGLAQRITDIQVVDVPVLEVDDHSVLIDKLYTHANQAIEQSGVQAFVLGCTGMLQVAEKVQKRLSEKWGNVPVVDPTGAAITLIESNIKLNLKPSKLCYYPPRDKKRS